MSPSKAPGALLEAGVQGPRDRSPALEKLLAFLTRDQTQALYSKSTDSLQLDHQGSPGRMLLFKSKSARILGTGSLSESAFQVAQW